MAICIMRKRKVHGICSAILKCFLNSFAGVFLIKSLVKRRRMTGLTGDGSTYYAGSLAYLVRYPRINVKIRLTGVDA